ncbi:MAG: CDP-alcohol phosphatidyltransferase family protein [Bacteroidota bacterium]
MAPTYVLHQKPPAISAWLRLVAWRDLPLLLGIQLMLALTLAVISDIAISNNAVLLLALGQLFVVVYLSITSWVKISRTATSRGFNQLGVANKITLIRGMIYGHILSISPLAFISFNNGGGIALTVQWWVVLLFISALLTDLADGQVARRLGETSAIGAQLDPEMDALGVLAALTWLIARGVLPLVAIVMGLLFVAYKLALLGYRLKGFVPRDLPDRASRAWLGVTQVVFLVSLMVPLESLTVGADIVAQVFTGEALTLATHQALQHSMTVLQQVLLVGFVLSSTGVLVSFGVDLRHQLMAPVRSGHRVSHH